MRILIAAGGFGRPDPALHLGAQLVGMVDGAVTILTVFKRQASKQAPDPVWGRAHELFQKSAVKVETKQRVGHPAEEIIHEAEQGNYDLVIVGERQKQRFISRFFLGSTAHRVVEHAPCPVVIAKGHISAIHRILVCDSRFDSPSLLTRFTTQLSSLVTHGIDVTILHVMSHMSAGPGVDGEQLRAGARELIEGHAPEGMILERDVEILRRLRIRCQPKVRHGLVVDEILSEARDGDYDLVVIGAHQGEGWRQILLDDLAHQIIIEMDRPVLVVR